MLGGRFHGSGGGVTSIKYVICVTLSHFRPTFFVLVSPFGFVAKTSSNSYDVKQAVFLLALLGLVWLYK